MHCGFMGSRLRRFPPDRASAVSYGQTVGNATRCPPLAHRSAAAHKLHSAQSNRYKIRESQNQIPGTGLSLFLPGDCPNDRDHRKNRSDFMLEAACERAQAVLLDQVFFKLDADKFEQFVALLDAPPKPNPGLERLMAVKPVWETPPA